MRTLLIVLLCTAGCKKTPTAESCGPLKLSMGGKELPAMTYGLAIKKHDGYEVEMFNMNKTTCENVLDPKGRNIPEGEDSVTAFAGGSGMMRSGVVYHANTVAGDKVKADVLLEPKAKGDKVQICVQDAKIELAFGEDKGKELTINGLFEGQYCGEMADR